MNPIDGLIEKASTFDVPETVTRLCAAIEAAGMTIFARIPHDQAATNVDMDLRPTEVVVFGNPKIGTTLMQSSQLIGLDLPLKVLAWEDAAGTTHLGYVDPNYLAARYGITDCDPVVAKMAGALDKFTEIASKDGKPSD